MRLTTALTIPAAALAQTSPLEITLFQALSLQKAVQVAAVLVVALVLVRVTGFVLVSLARRATRARFFFLMLAPLARFAIWLGAASAAIGIVAPSQQTLLAVVTAAAVALGLGAQDLVKNLIGGLVILVDRPYQFGDRVRIGDAYGEIDHIGLRSTKLTTPEDTRVTIPNSDILNGMAWNSNQGVPDCQVVTDVFLPPGTEPREAVEIGYEAAYCSPYLLRVKPVLVLYQDQFDENPYVRLRIKAYVYDHRFEPAFQSDVTQRAKSALLQRGMLEPWSPKGTPS